MSFINYKNLQVLSPAPAATAALALNNDLIYIADDMAVTKLVAANNLSDLTNVADALTNLGVYSSSAVDTALALLAPLASPTFTGTVTGTFSGNLTGDVTGNVSGTAGGLSANIAESQVTNLVSDLAAKAPLASPTFTGTISGNGSGLTNLPTPSTISGNITESQVTNLTTDLAAKVANVSGGTAGHLASLTSGGGIADSGIAGTSTANASTITPKGAAMLIGNATCSATGSSANNFASSGGTISNNYPATNCSADSNGTASATNSHADSSGTAIGTNSHADSNGTTSGEYSHADSYGTASNGYSHADSYASASGGYSHADSSGNASGQYSHANSGGNASGQYSHAHSSGNAATDYSTAIGPNSLTWGIGQLAIGGGANIQSCQRTINMLSVSTTGQDFVLNNQSGNSPVLPNSYYGVGTITLSANNTDDGTVATWLNIPITIIVAAYGDITILCIPGGSPTYSNWTGSAPSMSVTNSGNNLQVDFNSPTSVTATVVACLDLIEMPYSGGATSGS